MRQILVFLVILVMLAGGAVLGSSTYGPGNVFREWRLGHASRSCGFEINATLAGLEGSGLVEAALASGPERLGISIVYGEDGGRAYLMIGDQNNWIYLGMVSRGDRLVLKVSYSGGNVSFTGHVGKVAVKRMYNYGGPIPSSFRLVLSPLEGSGSMLIVKRMVVWRDWITYTLVSETLTPTPSTTPSISTVRTSSVSPSTSSQVSTSTLISPTIVSTLSMKGGRSLPFEAVIAVAVVLSVALVVLLRSRSRGPGPSG